MYSDLMKYENGYIRVIKQIMRNEEKSFDDNEVVSLDSNG